MAKLHIMSDVHLTHYSFQPPATDADIVILAGDVGVGTKGVTWAHENFPEKIIVKIPGNHCYYGTNRKDTLAQMRIAGQVCKVSVMDNDELILPEYGIRILGATLWTDFLLFGQKNFERATTAAQGCLNDFHMIYDGVGTFTPLQSIELHKESLAWLTAKLDVPFAGKTVIVTHHAPSMLSVADKYKDDIVSACFASNLDYLFGPKIDLWLHGHTHSSFDYSVNGTRILCNPRGYVTYYDGPENFDFNPALVVEL